MARLFGTDGVRGLANRDLTAELALDLSVAAAHVLADLGAFEGHRPVAVVGRDGRASGEFLAAAAAAGLASAGRRRPRRGRPAHAGRRVPHGEHRRRPRRRPVRLAQPDARQRAEVLRPWRRQAGRRARGRRRGAHARAVGPPDGLSRRTDPPVRPGQRGLPRTTCGLRPRPPWPGSPWRWTARTGPPSLVGPEVLRRAGASVIALASEPDGWNINDGCGSTHLEPLQRAVVEQGADLGPRAGRRRRPVPRRGGRRLGRRRRPDPGRAGARPSRGRSTRRTTRSSRRSWRTSVSAWGWTVRGSRSSRPRSATATSSRRCATGGTSSGASSPATCCSSTTPPRVTGCSPP